MTYDIPMLMEEEVARYPAADLPVPLPQMHKLMATLLDDYGVGGWDQDARMYVLIGDLDDPYFVKEGPPCQHPPTYLQQMYDHHVRVKKQVHAIAFAHETWRHLLFEEMQERYPETVAKLREQLKTMVAAMGGGDLDDEELDTLVERGYYGALAHFTAPSEQEDEHRVESRNVTVTFRNGATLNMMQDRDREPRMSPPIPWEAAQGARVPRFIVKALNDERPEDAPGEQLAPPHQES